MEPHPSADGLAAAMITKRFGYPHLNSQAHQSEALLPVVGAIFTHEDLLNCGIYHHTPDACHCLKKSSPEMRFYGT